jgi:cell division protein FtsB
VRGRRPSGEQRTSRSIKGLAILASIFVMLAVTLIPTLRSTLDQRSQINDLRSLLAQKRETVAALEQEQRQWADPAFVEQQARERLKFVRVGETSYTVIDAEVAPVDAGGPKIAAPARASTANSPWYGQLWQSMVIADASSTSAKVPVQAPARQPSTPPLAR